MTPYGMMQRASPYAHPHDVARGLTLAAVKSGVKRDAKGDTVLAQINPHEAAMLIAAGGSGRRDPQTGIIHFDPTGGSNAGGAGHAGDSGNNGGMGGGGGNASSGGTGRIGGGGGFGPGHAAAGDGSGNSTYSGTHASGPGFGSGPTGSPSGGYGQYGSNGGYNGGINVNLGRTIDGLALGMIPGAGPILSGVNSMIGPGWGPSLNIGGTTNGYSINGSQTGTYSLGGGSGGPSNVGNNNGQNGMGQQGGNGGFPGAAGGMPGAPGATLPGGAPQPAGGLPPPAALPPGAMPAQPYVPPQQNPYMPWRQLMAYQNAVNLGALPFALPGQQGA